MNYATSILTESTTLHVRAPTLPPESGLSLSEAEIKEITGYSRPAYQLKVLASLGVPARKRPDNSILVLRMHLMHPTAIAAVSAKNGPQLKSSRRKQ